MNQNVAMISLATEMLDPRLVERTNAARTTRKESVDVQEGKTFAATLHQRP